MEILFTLGNINGHTISIGLDGKTLFLNDGVFYTTGPLPGLSISPQILQQFRQRRDTAETMSAQAQMNAISISAYRDIVKDMIALTTNPISLMRLHQLFTELGKALLARI